MTATTSELNLFYWHCEVAANIIGTMPGNAATRSVSRHALRMGTLNLASKNGVFHASESARNQRDASGKPWSKAELIREHAVPISIIHRRVVDEVQLPRTEAALAQARSALESNLLATGFSPSKVAEFPRNPRTWYVVHVLRRLTHLAWVTRDDDQLLRAKPAAGPLSLHKHMPPDWDGNDPFARYRACGILVAPI